MIRTSKTMNTLKVKLAGLLLATVAVGSCSTANAQYLPPMKAREMRERQVIAACGAMADLKYNVLKMRMNGTKKPAAKQYIRDQLYASVPGIARETVDGYVSQVDSLYAAPPLRTEMEIAQVRSYMFNDCVDGMLADK